MNTCGRDVGSTAAQTVALKGAPGWNSIYSLRGSLTADLLENAYVYFVHSYAADVCQYTTATCNYVRPFSAMLHRDNFYAAQFHAEISGDAGQRILENFLKL